MNLAELLREGGGHLDATGAILRSMGLQAGAGLAGGSRGIADLLRGKGLQGAAAGAAETVGDVEDRFGGLAEPFSDIGKEKLAGMGRTIKGGVDWARKNVPGAQQAEQGWEDFSMRSPLAAALTAGYVEAGDPTKVGKGLRAGTAAERAIAKAREPTVPRSAAGLAPLVEAGEGDIARSMLAEKTTKGPRVPRAQVDEALANRAELRAEPPVLPKPAGEMTEAEWADFGNRYGVNMTRTPSQSLGISDLTTRKEIMVPGGLEGTFTLPDVFELKANNFDPNALPHDVHTQLMKKFLRTYDRGGELDPVDQYNSLNFALLSPNAPLTQNEFLAMRLRAQTPEDLNRIAGMEAEQARAAEQGTGAASRGGMGVKGTADLGNQPHMARMLRDSPQVTRRGAGETMLDVARRVMNQIPGLGPKTASLGVPWLDLPNADTSAVDLHMIRNNMARLMQDPELGAAFTERLAKLTNQPGATPEQLIAQHKGPDATAAKLLEKAAINVVSSHPDAKYRLKGGEVNPRVHEAVQPERLGFEPESTTEFGPYYKRIVDYVNESRGANPELALFPEQWRLWDRYRGRVEPHEMAHPDVRKLPKMSWEEMQKSLGQHKAQGYTSTFTDPITGEVHSQRLRDVPTDWRKLAYFTAPPVSLAELLRQQRKSSKEGSDAELVAQAGPLHGGRGPRLEAGQGQGPAGGRGQGVQCCRPAGPAALDGQATAGAMMAVKCRLCGRAFPREVGYVKRVNPTGNEGIWECRPMCGADLPQETNLLLAIEDAIEGDPPSGA